VIKKMDKVDLRKIFVKIHKMEYLEIVECKTLLIQLGEIINTKLDILE